MQSFTPLQQDLLQALSSGLSITAAAERAGIHRTTIHHWSRTIPEFRNALAAIRMAKSEELREELDSLVPQSLAVLKETLADHTASRALRVRVALSILKSAAAPEKAAPKNVGSEFALLLAAHAMGQQNHHEAAAQPAVHRNSSNSSLSSDSSPDEFQPQTPRNAPCPCGSKQKFKRCCGRNAPPVLNRAA
ncbi:MAG: SEC-C domain-containing protein [Bryobacterales bacterium]|nr:SEC-C domain-containing protein [Bryobacterales bacterium]